VTGISGPLPSNHARRGNALPRSTDLLRARLAKAAGISGTSQPTGGHVPLDALKGVVARHLDRFAFREAPLRFDWQDEQGSDKSNFRFLASFGESESAELLHAAGDVTHCLA
jgi:hypothetical protein